MRNAEHQFVSTDTAAIIAELTAMYEVFFNVSVLPGSPENLFLRWMANLILAERVRTNYTGNQNLPSRAVGDNLDNLAELFYIGERPGAKPAVCTERFYIAEAQDTSILIPNGTRVTARGDKLTWETTADAYIPIGELFADIAVHCQEPGVIGNGYTIGQINNCVDVFLYFERCENITESGGGSEIPNDTEFFNLMRESEDAYSTAGAIGGYVYFAKSVSTEIKDVVPNSPIPGHVNIYALMSDGTPANEETKSKILAACSDKTIRPLTDFVQMRDPETVNYDIELTYYITQGTQQSAEEIETAVNSAAANYITWQCGKFGRAINPSYLIGVLMQAGIKRVELVSPAFTTLRNGTDFDPLSSTVLEDSVPQIASINAAPILINGGFEDE
jgi:hypothetical protein